jgi:hypothetical protein
MAAAPTSHRHKGKGGRCVGLKTLSPYCADCLEIWEPQPAVTLRACPGTVMGLLYRPVRRADNLITLLC